MGKTKERLLTGLQSSGDLHIGNYFGALQPFLSMYQAYDSFLMVADYHSLTSVRNADVLRQNTINVVKDYLAIGVDPAKCTIFRQSDNQDHMELAWVLNCMVTVPFLQQGHAYKDKVAKGIDASAGLFTYPVLQAADIALYQTDIVPVGEDQRQHIEYTREAIGKFNRAYDMDVLTEPAEAILENAGIVPGIDGNKMAKSAGNGIPLFGTTEDIEKACMKIVTDSGAGRPEHVYNIHALFRPAKELESIYTEHAGRYGDLKKILAADIDTFISPLRERRADITDADVAQVLADGAARAKEVSNQTMEEVRQIIGIR